VTLTLSGGVAMIGCSRFFHFNNPSSSAVAIICVSRSLSEPSRMVANSGAEFCTPV